MNDLPRDILHCIGNTSLLALRNIVPRNGARLLLKLENENPTGSMKDRMALAMIEAAEADGRLGAGGSVVEYTGGSTGVSLSLVCAVKGYPLHIVSSDAFAREKLDHMRILGAELQIVPQRQRAHDREADPRHDRGGSRSSRSGPAASGPISSRTRTRSRPITRWPTRSGRRPSGRIDGFVQSVGTAASLRGTAEGLRRHDARIRIVAVEPAESAVLSGGPPGAHKIDGIGAGFVVPLWQDGIADRDRAGLDGGGGGDGPAARSRGGPLRGNVHRRQRHRRAASWPSGWGPARRSSP